ncbi:aspartate carbamoyltransferase catalytic subunit [Oceanobacillus halotolerans]|uniref:aspartate carbamoyltransferase catalytic subunit n=1 Tax=Oceanobacillus halotolerans TaxID=2663380 RepID=UPI0013D93E1A|nr:aspartate carbamoyltransferase catalytic subunit [Oceanobacillus halotolerans]
MQHNFLSTQLLSREELLGILSKAECYRKGYEQITQPIFAANLFFEPSTRTKMSFIVAQRKLGIEVLDFHTDQASVQKGESLYDTVKTMEAIGADLVVIRHQDDNWYEALLPYVSIPVINAGAGKGEHPTQSMLDLLTIYQEFSSFQNVNVVIAGDIKHSRVARSNMYALDKLGANVYLCAAPGLEDESLGFKHVSIDEAVEIADALMMLRIQHERHINNFQSTNSYLEDYGLTKEREQRMKDHAIIMHPAPVNRGVEIDGDLVECGRSRIFKQMENGVYVRMAIMANLLKQRGMLHETFTTKRQAITS